MGGVGGVIHNTINKYYRRTRNNNSFFFQGNTDRNDYKNI